MIIDTEKYRKLIKHMREEAQDYRSGKTLGRAFVDAEDVLDEAADAIGDLLAALTPPNEALTCEGCACEEYRRDTYPCNCCARNDETISDQYRPPEGEPDA